MSIGIKYAIVLTQVLLLTGCVAKMGVNREYVSNANQKTPTGTISVAYAEHGQWKYMLQAGVYFRSIDGKIDGAVANDSMRFLLTGERLPIPISSDLVLDVENPMGRIHAIELPVGDYEFYRYNAYVSTPLPSGTATHTLNSKYPFSAKFTVESDTVTYVGRLTFDYLPDRRVGFKIANRSKDDMAVFRRNYKEFENMPFKITVPNLR